jgi:hypothetical protein
LEELTQWYGSAMSWAHEYFYAYAREACRLYDEVGDRERAARYAARSLWCYHYTIEMLDEGEYHEMLRELLAEYPSAFSEDARVDVSLFGWEPDLVAESTRMENQGRLDRAVKLLVDAEYFSPEGNSYLGRLHHLLLRLDWKWAAGLAALRS